MLRRFVGVVVVRGASSLLNSGLREDLRLKILRVLMKLDFSRGFSSLFVDREMSEPKKELLPDGADGVGRRDRYLGASGEFDVDKTSVV